MDLARWNEFLEAKKSGGKLTDFGPNCVNDSKPIVRVAEKSKDGGLGDKATPALKKAKDNMPLGTSPNYTNAIKEASLPKLMGSGKGKAKKPLVRGTEKNKGELRIQFRGHVRIISV